MKTSFTKSESKIHISGCLPETVPFRLAVDTLRAYAFLGESIEVDHGNGKKVSNRDIAKPSGLTDSQAAIACSLLCHGLRYKIERFLPVGTKIEVIDVGFSSGEDPQASWQSEIMLEINGYTIAPSIELNHGYRGAIKWHTFDPHGDAIVENTVEKVAVFMLISSIMANTIEEFYITETTP